MSNPIENSDWTWSEEHGKWYRQVFQKGVWVTIWEENHQASHIRVDSVICTDRPFDPDTFDQPSPVPVNPTVSTPSLTTGHPYGAQYSNAPQGFTPWPPLYNVPLGVLGAQQQHAQQHAGPLHANTPQQWPQTGTLQVPNRPQMPRGIGKWVQGTYVQGRSLHYETIDTSFFVRLPSFFTVGKYFAVILAEEAGSTATDYTTSITTVRFGLKIHTSARRFIVVRANREFCYACPIFTYGGRGTLKPGVRSNEHTIVYSSGTSPQLLPGEPSLRKQPICVEDAEGIDPLNSASRLYLGIHHPIQYNVKVKDLGHVHPEHIQNLRGYWAAVNQDITSQPIEVTAGAQDEEEDDDDEDDEDDDDDDDDDDEDSDEEDPPIVS